MFGVHQRSVDGHASAEFKKENARARIGIGLAVRTRCIALVRRQGEINGSPGEYLRAVDGEIPFPSDPIAKWL